MELRDSRRLTGPSLLQDLPAAVLDVSDASEDEIRAWEAALCPMLVALGWEASTIAWSRHPGGASLSFTAPVDALYAATEVNEWALAAATAADPPDMETDAARLRALIANERNPALLALRDAARRRGVRFLSDDDLASVGSGTGARVWPVDDLPAPAAVDWSAVHDVPAVLVTGTNGKSTTVRLLAAIARAAGRTPGLCSTDWIGIGDEIVDRGDYSGPGGARTVLRHPATEIAILETARGGMLRRGLATSQADAAAVLNVAPDHLGEFGIADLAALTEVKFLVRKALVGSRPLVVNADDANVRDRAHRLDVPLTWFSANATTPPADRAYVVVDGTFVAIEQDERHAVIAVADAPCTLGGAAGYNVANASASIALARAIGLPFPAIAAGLRSFESSPEANPGRGNLFRLGGVAALVDFAHNAHGLAALTELARALPARRRLLILGQAGDRTDAEIREMTAVAARAGMDHILVKELTEHLRGREQGEVAGLIASELRAAGATDFEVVASERDAVARALAWAETGDLLLLLVHAGRGETLALLADLEARGWKPGEAI